MCQLVHICTVCYTRVNPKYGGLENVLSSLGGLNDKLREKLIRVRFTTKLRCTKKIEKLGTAEIFELTKDFAPKMHPK